MGVCVEKLPCSKCGSSDALQVYRQDDGTHDAYCFSCGAYISDPYSTNVSEPLKPIEAVIKHQFEPIDITHDDHERKIKKATFDYFGVKTEVSPKDGYTVVSHYYPVTSGGTITGWKHRKTPKEFLSYGETKGADLFGQTQCVASKSKKLYITEGELDALSLHQAISDRQKGTQWENYHHSIVAIRNGAQSAAKSIGAQLAFIKGYEQVILCFDMDTAGRTAIDDVVKLLPEAFILDLPEKDCNEMLMKGRDVELAKLALFGSTRRTPASILSGSQAFERAIKMPTMGLEWPWPTLTKLTYGIHRKKLYGLGAGVGIGKSDWAKELQAHIINRHQKKVGVFMLEEDVGRTLKGIAGKIVGKQFHKPNEPFTQQELIEGIEKIKDHIFLYDHFGMRDWSDIKAAIRYLVVVEGVKDIFLDPLTALVAHLSSAEANDALNTIMGDLSGMIHELDFSAFYFSHLNTPQNGPPHERGGKVHESQFTGSRAMMKWSHYIFGLERNKDPELPIELRNTSTFVLLKDREFGNVGQFPIYYHENTGRFLEPLIGG